MLKLNKCLYATLLAAGLLVAGSVSAADKVAIPFADLGNIRDWHADNHDEMFVQAMNRDWYRITFWAPCNELPFAIGVAFVTDSMGSLDKYSSILVNGERCYFRSFEKSAPPPSHDDTEAPKADTAR